MPVALISIELVYMMTALALNFLGNSISESLGHVIIGEFLIEGLLLAFIQLIY
jgi:hypothetical protein